MAHEANAGYQPGNHWCECQRCGFDYRASQMRKEWNGSLVCEDCYEPRHPQDFVKSVKESPSAKGIVTSEISKAPTLEGGADAGDANLTLTVGLSNYYNSFDTTLTANRTVTLSTTNAFYGAGFRIERTDTSAYTVDIGGLYTMPVSQQAYAVVEYNGSAWTLLDSGTV